MKHIPTYLIYLLLAENITTGRMYGIILTTRAIELVNYVILHYIKQLLSAVGTYPYIPIQHYDSNNYL